MIDWWFNGPLSAQGELSWGSPMEWVVVAAIVGAGTLALTARRKGGGRPVELVCSALALCMAVLIVFAALEHTDEEHCPRTSFPAFM